MSSDSPDAPLSAIWTGVAGSYDAYRPRTSAVLLDLLTVGRKASIIWIYPRFCLHQEAYTCLTSLASVALYS
jgi:hypothetical protein